MAMDNLKASFICLENYQLKTCLFCLTMFPENAVIKKRTLIYWWIGEGLVNKMKNKTAEEVGEQVFQELINEGFIKPISKNNSPSINSCKLRKLNSSASIRIGHLVMAHDEHILYSGTVGSNGTNVGDKEEELKTVFNINEQYLEFKVDWLPKLKSVEVLQLGRWQNSIKHHIEIENKEPLNGLGSQKQLKYLSLRGISRIDTLPSSIVKLDSLTILDLRACHNLEKLPTGLWMLRHLTHLDVSECYLLESIPKGVQHLSSLQVLKGFVIGNLGKNPCKISDLERLKNLRKLSIRVGVPEWLWPSKLQTLKKLYIRGGQLESLNHEEENQHWKIKNLRLKYLKCLKIEKNELLEKFPELLYLERVSCHKNYPDIIIPTK
ncbi:Leucine-rich repeat (LRR) family protein [Forsythia ovata]|uniref:Leucine-rich repeat (LRR) family protein n=1 Tax=Forsythia ovata TaxID=205694 RepID=A0ABD1VHU6_9LAMI